MLDFFLYFFFTCSFLMFKLVVGEMVLYRFANECSFSVGGGRICCSLLRLTGNRAAHLKHGAQLSLKQRRWAALNRWNAVGTCHQEIAPYHFQAGARNLRYRTASDPTCGGASPAAPPLPTLSASGSRKSPTRSPRLLRPIRRILPQRARKRSHH